MFAVLQYVLPSVRTDAKKSAVKTQSGMAKIPGKKCKNGYISANYKCSDESTRTATGKRKLTKEGRAAAAELAVKVRALKGLRNAESGGEDKKAVAARQSRKLSPSEDFLKSDRKISDPSWHPGLTVAQRVRLGEESQDWWASLSPNERGSELRSAGVKPNKAISRINDTKAVDAKSPIALGAKVASRLDISYAQKKSKGEIDKDRMLAGGLMNVAKQKYDLATQVKSGVMDRESFLLSLGVPRKDVSRIESTKDMSAHPVDPKTGSTVSMTPSVKKHVRDYWALKGGKSMSAEAYSGISAAKSFLERSYPKPTTKRRRTDEIAFSLKTLAILNSSL